MRKGNQDYQVKHYPTSKRRSKNKGKDNMNRYMNYRTSTSSCSNHSYLNPNLINNQTSAAPFTDCFPVKGKRGKKRQINNTDDQQVILSIPIIPLIMSCSPSFILIINRSIITYMGI